MLVNVTYSALHIVDSHIQVSGNLLRILTDGALSVTLALLVSLENATLSPPWPNCPRFPKCIYMYLQLYMLDVSLCNLLGITYSWFPYPCFRKLAAQSYRWWSNYSNKCSWRNYQDSLNVLILLNYLKLLDSVRKRLGATWPTPRFDIFLPCTLSPKTDFLQTYMIAT